jgi:hypothetical protein
MSQPARASMMGVPRMTATQYSKYTLISRPYYDDKLAGWIPNASVVRVFGGSDHNNFYFHQMRDPLKQSFEREEQALCFGFIIGRAFIETISPIGTESIKGYLRSKKKNFTGSMVAAHGAI